MYLEYFLKVFSNLDFTYYFNVYIAYVNVLLRFGSILSHSKSLATILEWEFNYTALIGNTTN